jgi:hypothetical protein
LSVDVKTLSTPITDVAVPVVPPTMILKGSSDILIVSSPGATQAFLRVMYVMAGPFLVAITYFISCTAS